jgi:hypothetical protein
VLSWEEADEMLSRKGLRRRQAPGPARPAAPSRAEALVRRLLDRMCGADEAVRRAAADRVRRSDLLPVGRLVLGLAERLLAGPAAVSRAAQASLVQLGDRAVPALTARLMNARAAAEQLALVKTLYWVGAGASGSRRVQLVLDLGAAKCGAADGAVVAALNGAIIGLRWLTC